MNIKIGENIAKYRKRSGTSQAELAEYLGVSSQAVSKWENGNATPDIFLIPKIAFFFGISIDTLFGTVNEKTVSLEVDKYSVKRNDANYKEANEAINTFLEQDSENLEGYALRCHLEYQKALEHLEKSEEACKTLLKLSQKKKNHDWEKRARFQLMREDSMLGNLDFVHHYEEKYQENPTKDNLNLYLGALSMGDFFQCKETLHIGKQCLNQCSDEEKVEVYPNLMEFAYTVGDEEYVKQCFDAIIAGTKDKNQIYNAWWLLWKTYQKVGDEQEAERCRQSLLEQLEGLGLNEYKYERMKKSLESEDEKVHTVL